MPHVTMVDPLIKMKLRGLRLWHWRLALQHRAAERELEALAEQRKSGSLKSSIKTYADAANVHFSAVQTLNEFFEIDDTAERDEAENETDD